MVYQTLQCAASRFFYCIVLRKTILMNITEKVSALIMYLSSPSMQKARGGFLTYLKEKTQFEKNWNSRVAHREKSKKRSNLVAFKY